ncbi:hypothetical protein GQ53DRAFT_617270, partial [Thozetella sp. PMI_491]
DNQGPQSERPPKRIKDDSHRTRVTRACDRCKSRKTRCSGKFPCAYCSQQKLECRFTALYRRGRLPSIEIGPGRPEATENEIALSSSAVSAPQHMESGGRRMSAQQQTSLPSSMENQGSDQLPANGSAQGGVQTESGNSAIPSMVNSPDASQTDQQGHFVGPASGVSFLLRIQRRLQQESSGVSTSSIFTFGDLPMPTFEQTFLILPPRSHAEDMVQRYFEFASATHRFLHRPSVEAWLEELYENKGTMKGLERARSRTAVLFMVFAHSTNFQNLKQLLIFHLYSARYFAAAEHQLSAEKGEICLTSVQARLAQCFYLLAQSRLNHCWTLFGITAHLSLALGIHRKARVDPKSPNVDYIDLECRKRTFWCVFNLNMYLSATLGRPMTFHDDDIDQEYPMCIDDSQLRHRHASPPRPVGQSIMSAPVAHCKLSRIIAKILRSLYGIRSLSTEEQLELAVHYTGQLKEWREEISHLLDTEGSSSFFVPLVLRQRDILKLAFWHAEILVHRPFLLKSFASLSNYRTNRSGKSTSKKKEIAENVNSCLDAAMGIVEIVGQIDVAGQLFPTLFLIPYFAFSAIVILYVHTIQQQDTPPETYLHYFRVATRCHRQLETIAAKGSLTQRFCVVLQELRLELLAHNTYLSALS